MKMIDDANNMMVVSFLQKLTFLVKTFNNELEI